MNVFERIALWLAPHLSPEVVDARCSPPPNESRMDLIRGIVEKSDRLHSERYEGRLRGLTLQRDFERQKTEHLLTKVVELELDGARKLANGPPCTRCKHWGSWPQPWPHDSGPPVRCNAENMWPDFSCLEPSSPSTPAEPEKASA